METNKTLRYPHSLTDAVSILQLDSKEKKRSEAPPKFPERIFNFYQADILNCADEATKQIYFSPPKEIIKELVASFGEIYKDLDVQTSSNFLEVNQQFKKLNESRDQILDLVPNKRFPAYQKMEQIKYTTIPELFIVPKNEYNED